MSAQEDNAFPSLFYHDVQRGLTKREYFAALAMQGFVQSTTLAKSPQSVAELSVKYADALIRELEKTP